jgi:predicted 3-demethylubiquinone-9 3-methyltransferase (glyoxalase superfamily)
MATKVATHLMFQNGEAEEAMKLYVSLFSGSKIGKVARYGADGPGGPEKAGTIQVAHFELAGREFICIDSPMKHDFDFTPAVSIFVDCENEQELQRVFDELSKGGKVFMPPDNYGFSQRFGWVSDRYGVSWQLNLP